MDREKVIRGLQAHADGCGYRSHHCDAMECPYRYGDESCDIEEMCRDALALLKEQEERWIPVTERLPRSIANKVLVYVQHEDYVGYIGYGHYEKYKGQEMWFDLEHDEEFSKRGYHVTHWMETPMPPREVK